MSVSGITSSSVSAAYTPPPAQQLAKDGDTQAQESSETSAEKSS